MIFRRPENKSRSLETDFVFDKNEDFNRMFIKD